MQFNNQIDTFTELPRTIEEVQVNPHSLNPNLTLEQGEQRIKQRMKELEPIYLLAKSQGILPQSLRRSGFHFNTIDKVAMMRLKEKHFPEPDELN